MKSIARVVVRAFFAVMAIGLVLPLAADQSASSDSLRSAKARLVTFEERVAAQRAIERVYFGHRIWPAGNPGPKPSFEETVPESVLRQKVEDTLKKSNALAALWGRPITSHQLQEEMGRLTRDSRQPQVLRELYAALGNDPVLIAECLARPLLADRLERNWYAWDRSRHGSLKSEILATLEQAKRPGSVGRGRARLGELARKGGTYAERTWVRRPEGTPAPGSADPSRLDVIDLDPVEWDEHVGSLKRRIAAETLVPGAALPVGRLGPLVEDETGFSVTAVLEQRDGRITVGSVSWPKTPFDVWWRNERGTISAEVPELGADGGIYELVVPLEPTCEPEKWTRPGSFPPSVEGTPPSGRGRR